MSDEQMILKNPPLTQDQNYAFLRSEGLKYIEELGSTFWTDYNEHDPGITILEALCYAITELGYRTGLPMNDLLTEADGKIKAKEQALFTAKEILTQSPLTKNDYRKLLIDIVGVHNAWLFSDDFYQQENIISPAGEVSIYADCKKNKLVTDYTTPHPIYLSGLYKVLLDLDNDDQLGDLNNGAMDVFNPPTPTFKAGDVSLSVIFQAWNETDPDLWKANPNSISINNVSITEVDKAWAIAITFNFMPNPSGNPLTLNGRVVVDLQPANHILTTSEIQFFFSDSANAFARQVLNLYVLKIQKAYNIIQTAKRKLLENRNLCEDFVSVETIKDEEVAICCDIEVRPDADMEKVQAEVFFAIEEYLNPSVHFYLIKEMMDKGYTVDEIFEGPKLEHGFIDTEELEKAQLRNEIHAPDIINLLMDIGGVLAVRSFRMTKYDNNGEPVPGQTGKPWCMPISLWHKPVFSETKSKILFFKNNFPYLPGLAEVRDTLKWLHALNMRNKLTGHSDDIEINRGRYYALGDYTSMQYLLPQTYGIGTAGLPARADTTRTAQARQLKAYLLFYDQLLGDFFSQLKNAKELFSTDAIVQTYFAQYLNNIKDIEPIYVENGIHQKLLQLLLATQDSSATTVNDWQKLYETNETFLDRRNRFLDHLMARFAELFNEYVLLMFTLDVQKQSETHIDPKDLIDNKIAFVKNYPDISYQRGRAYNYYPQKFDVPTNSYVLDTTQLWDTDNVSGLEKKISFLGGIDDFTRRFLYCSGHATIIDTADTPPKHRFQFTNANGDMLTSIAAFTTVDEVNNALIPFINFILSEANYLIEETSGHWNLFVTDADGNKLANSNDFADEDAATKAKQAFIDFFNKECDNEGLHLIEHILLRPRTKAFEKAEVCLDPNCDFCGEQDPYSFRMSVVMPYWPLHFRSLAFRNYFENLVRSEAPAHTMIRICWVDNISLNKFEVAYKDWIEALAHFNEDEFTLDDFRKKNDALVEILFKELHSKYPEATLHNCTESELETTVLLGKTILGSFKM